jgi:predicted nucleic acid-binding Zn ribbon protein
LIMPVYVYRRDDGSTFEIEQRMTARALRMCPTTGRGVKRVLQPFAPRYNGSGFCSTDHRKPDGDGTTSTNPAEGHDEASRGPRAAAGRPRSNPLLKGVQ